MEEDKSPLELLKDWKNKLYRKTNYNNIYASYGDQKYIRMKPKSQISITPGFLYIILKHPKEYVKQNFKLERDVTLCNETHNVIYFSLEESLLSEEENDYKLHVKNGIPKNEEKWEIDI
tara:strand:- start:112 stop:468 length:357 start_codon:yes stop_codon:yes gene_type:complete